MEFVYRIEEINEVAGKVRDEVKGYNVVAFEGEMGAGKTTFIHALCRHLGVKGAVSSPTFSIINEYESSEGLIYHIDLYRCNNEEEAIRAGVEYYLNSGHTCFVEWPARAPGIFPDNTIRIGISEVDGMMRRITVQP